MPINLESSQPISSQPSQYQISKQSEKKLYEKEDHIIRKTPLLGAKITADKLAHDAFVYAPKGLRGSRNSNFYEFLSLGMVPYIIGSLTMVSLYTLANKHYFPSDRIVASQVGKRVACGVAFYALGKWLGGKILNKGVHALTGVDPEMPYKKTVHELPEGKGEKPGTSTEFHRVYESVDFPRWDLINRKGEFEGDRYAYYDKIARRMGYKEKLNAPDQVAQPKIRETMAKTTATRNITSYLWAAAALAFGMQDDTSLLISKYAIPKNKKQAKELWHSIKSSVRDVAGNFWSGGGRKSTRIIARTLSIAALASTVLGLANIAIGFRNKKSVKTEVDFNKKYEEC